VRPRALLCEVYSSNVDPIKQSAFVVLPPTPDLRVQVPTSE
jgi:hypothetical protein